MLLITCKPLFDFVVWYIICVNHGLLVRHCAFAIIPGHQEFCFLGQTAKQINHLTLPDKLGDFEGGTEELAEWNRKPRKGFNEKEELQRIRQRSKQV